MFAAVAIASVTFTSCDGYLETFPSDSLVSTDAITTLQDVETALNGTYYSLKSASYYGCDFVSRAEVGGEDVQTISSGGLRTDTYIVSHTVRITLRKTCGVIRMLLSIVRMYC